MNSLPEHPIGIFDSGIGGLTVAGDISRKLPNEHLIYFGDTAHLPYGDKSSRAICNYSRQIARFLLEQDCKTIVVACNSASSVAIDLLNEEFGHQCHIINVVDPIVQSAAMDKTIKKIGIIGTKATIFSGIYEQKLLKINPELKVVSLSTPLLAPMIESGFFNNKISKVIIENYFKYPDFEDIDGLILACTHYPLIKNDISSILGNHVKIFDSTGFLSDEVYSDLKERKLLTPSEKKGTKKFFVSDYTEGFKETAAFFYGKETNLKLAAIFKETENDV